MANFTVPAANPDFAALQAYAGEYKNALIKKLYFDLNLEADGVLVIPGVKNKLNMHKMLVKKGLKPFTGVFNAKANDISFEPRVLSVDKAQRDMQIQPSLYLPTFMAKLRAAGENAANLSIPFAQHMWEEVIRETANEIVTETVYNGVGAAAFAAYGAGTAYAVGDLVKYTQDGEVRYFRCIAITTAGQNPDTHPAKWEWAGGRAIAKGFNSIFATEVAGGGLVPIATGAITNSTAYAQFLQMFRGLPEQVRKAGAMVYCSMTSKDYLNDDYENRISKNFETIDGITYLAKTDRKCIVKPVDWLTNTGRLIATVPNNLVIGTDSLSDATDIKVMEQMYHIDAGMTFMYGSQIQDLDVIRINDQQ